MIGEGRWRDVRGVKMEVYSMSISIVKNEIHMRITNLRLQRYKRFLVKYLTMHMSEEKNYNTKNDGDANVLWIHLWHRQMMSKN